MPRIVEGRSRRRGGSSPSSSRASTTSCRQAARRGDRRARAHGAGEDDIEIFRTPGSFELPAAAKRITGANRHDAVICLGVLIRGDTPHFDHISAEVTKGVAQVGLDAKVPVIYGVITADTLEQAIDRAGTKSGTRASTPRSPRSRW